MRTTTTAAAVTAAVLIFTLGACSSSGGDDGPTVSKASSSQTSSPSPTASPSPEQQLEFKIGDTADIEAEDGDLSAAALSFRDSGIRSSIPGLLKDGQKWALVEAKVCNKGGEVMTVSPFVWTLAYEDGARVEATHLAGTDLPGPLYPMDAKVKAGNCVRGNIIFEVPKDGRAERVLYSPDVLDEPVEWKIGKG